MRDERHQHRAARGSQFALRRVKYSCSGWCGVHCTNGGRERMRSVHQRQGEGTDHARPISAIAPYLTIREGRKAAPSVF